MNFVKRMKLFLNETLVDEDLQTIYRFFRILAVSPEELERGISLVSSDAERINKVVSSVLQMNSGKSDVMIIGSESNISKIDFNSISKVHVTGVYLEYSKTKMNVGVISNENFTFKAHNDDAKIRKAYGLLNRIRHTRHNIPNYIKRDIVTALVDPVLDYDYDYDYVRSSISVMSFKKDLKDWIREME